MPLAECNETILSDGKNQESTELKIGVDKSQYCAHDPSGKKGCYPTGNGGVLQTTQSSSNPVKVVGVASFGIKCDSSCTGVYTRVAHYIEWIGAHVWTRGEIHTPHVSDADNEKNDNDRYIFKSK